ncbi:MAG: hypothetical protein J6S14_15020 [Clostridia bacterium]|nr:hypothetical protein [Clostridia bacterium]
MVIRNGEKIVNVKSVVSDTMKRNGKSYPALRFDFADEITAADLSVLMSGSFEILDNEGNVLGVHEGYNTLKSLSVSVGKITPDEQKIEELEASNAKLSTNLETAQAENAELQNAIDIMVGGSAE